MKSIIQIVLLLFLTSFYSNSQTETNQKEEEKKQVKVAFFDGTVVAGYVDQGVFINFLGPNISLSKGKSRFSLGMLPSLRFKEDRSTGTKNSPITPNLGVGFTYSYKKIAFQLPLYYNVKTASNNGKWTVGLGIGYRFK